MLASDRIFACLPASDSNQSNNKSSVYNQSAFDPNNKQLASFCEFINQLRRPKQLKVKAVAAAFHQSFQ